MRREWWISKLDELLEVFLVAITIAAIVFFTCTHTHGAEPAAGVVAAAATTAPSSSDYDFSGIEKRVGVLEADVATLKTDVADLKAKAVVVKPKFEGYAAAPAISGNDPKDRTPCCDCGPDCYCEVCNCKPTSKASPSPSKAGELSITVNEASPAVTTYERVKVCGPNGKCDYQWRAVATPISQQPAKQTEPVYFEMPSSNRWFMSSGGGAYSYGSDGSCYVEKRGFFGRVKLVKVR